MNWQLRRSLPVKNSFWRLCCSWHKSLIFFSFHGNKVDKTDETSTVFLLPQSNETRRTRRKFFCTLLFLILLLLISARNKKTAKKMFSHRVLLSNFIFIHHVTHFPLFFLFLLGFCLPPIGNLLQLEERRKKVVLAQGLGLLKIQDRIVIHDNSRQLQTTHKLTGTL